ncbi:MAG: DNA-binding protein [Candidatus Thermoplasmatota archaeon]
MDEELEKIKKKKLEQLKKQQSYKESMEEQQEREKQRVEAQKQHILRSVLTPKARERLGRIKIARPKVAESIEKQLIMQAQSGRLNRKINDEQLKNILSQIMPKKRDINIRRK